MVKVFTATGRTLVIPNYPASPNHSYKDHEPRATGFCHAGLMIEQFFYQ